MKGSRDLRLKVETSNLAHRLGTGGPNGNNAKLSKGVAKGSRDLLLEISAYFICRELFAPL